jgi:hypothetical protein
MELISSYVGIEQDATIYAYDLDVLTPLGINLRSPKTDQTNQAYQASCAIIEHNSNKYVISCRTNIIWCKKIILIYCKWGKVIYSNELHILFQSIETNLIILGTVGHDKLKLELSQEMAGRKDGDGPGATTNLDIPAMMIIDKFTNPKMKKDYYANMVEIDLDHNTYNQNIYQFKYLNSFATNHHYLPSIWMYEFGLTKKCKANIAGLCGGLMYNQKKKLIGLVTSHMAQSNSCAVLPVRHLYKIINIFFDRDNKANKLDNLNNLNSYARSFCLPISYSIQKKKGGKKHDLIITSSFVPELKPKDKIVGIDNKDISIEPSGASVYDDKYEEYIPFDIYVRLNFNPYSQMGMAVERNKKVVSCDLSGDPIENHMLWLTDQADFMPKDPIPFINLEGLIAVQLTHELIDIFASNSIKLHHRFIEKFMESADNKKINRVLVIADVSKKKKINIKIQKSGNEFDTLDCYILYTINGTKVRKLGEIEPLLKKQNIVVVSDSTSKQEINCSLK